MAFRRLRISNCYQNIIEILNEFFLTIFVHKFALKAINKRMGNSQLQMAFINKESRCCVFLDEIVSSS